jgi:hypothetical protein
MSLGLAAERPTLDGPVPIRPFIEDVDDRLRDVIWRRIMSDESLS